METTPVSSNPYILAGDLGQAQDPTALAVVRRDRVIDEASGKLVTAYRCQHLERFELGTPYPTIVSHVAAMLETPALCGSVLVLDATGVGRPVVDMFRAARLGVE